MKRQYKIIEASTIKELQEQVTHALEDPHCELAGGISTLVNYHLAQAVVIKAQNDKEND